MSIPSASASSTTNINEPFEIVLSDIMAKFKVQSRNGNNYCFIFMNKVTKYLLPYFGKSKDQLVKSLDKFREEFIEIHGLDWKILQNDSEEIYMSGKVKEFCIKHQINQRFFAPYKHQQNGGIENKIRDIQDLVRTF